MSVITPVYNGARYIRKSLKSVLNQRFDSFEIIVVDDGSVDGTADIVLEVSSENKGSNPEVRLIRQNNMGVSSARNTGIDHASGKYIVFFDADDQMNRDFLAKLYDCAESSEADVTVCGFDVADADGSTLKPYSALFSYLNDVVAGPEAAHLMLRGSIFVWTGSGMYRSDLLKRESLKFTDGCSYCEDHEFAVKALFCATNVSGLDESLVKYVQRNDSAHNSRSIRDLFHCLGARRRLRKFISSAGASDELLSILDHGLIPGAYVSVLIRLMEEGKSSREIRQLLSNTETKKVFNDMSSAPQVNRGVAFLMNNFPLLFLKLWRFRDRRSKGRYF